MTLEDLYKIIDRKTKLLIVNEHTNSCVANGTPLTKKGNIKKEFKKIEKQEIEFFYILDKDTIKIFLKGFNNNGATK